MDKRIRMSLVLAIAVLALLFTASHVLGYAGVGDVYGVDSKAKGDEYSGTLAIYLEETSSKVFDMYFIVRLSHKKNWYSFSSVVSGVGDTSQELREAFNEFIENTLIVEICPTEPRPSFDNGGVALKAITDQFFDTGYTPYYFIADIVIAVQQ